MSEQVAAPTGRTLTVGIPVFNGRALLRSCLESVVASTLPHDRFEVLLADDGSSEPETLAILDETTRRFAGEPGFLRVISLEVNSGGAARPRNRILDEATGAYVFFVDSDDTIGDQALERIADALEERPADWVGLNQVLVNGRGSGTVIRHPRAEVPRSRALSTLTVHKVFRRDEIERQGLRFDEGLPSGQDIAFSFAFIVNASRFLMLGGYDYYFLTHHGGNPDEPVHLSRRTSTADGLIEKYHRILTSMLDALHRSPLEEEEQRRIAHEIALPRVLVWERYLVAISNARPRSAHDAMRRLAELLDDPLVRTIDLTEPRKGLTAEHLAAVRAGDLTTLQRLVRGVDPAPRATVALVERWSTRARRAADLVRGMVGHRQLVTELDVLRRSVQELQAAQSRLEAELQALRLRR